MNGVIKYQYQYELSARISTHKIDKQRVIFYEKSKQGSATKPFFICGSIRVRQVILSIF